MFLQSPYPFLRYSLALGTGIAFSWFFVCDIAIVWGGLLACLVLYGSSFFFQRLQWNRDRLFQGFLALIFLFCTGILLEIEHKPQVIYPNTAIPEAVKGLIMEVSETGNNAFKLVLNSETGLLNGNQIPFKHGLLVYTTDSLKFRPKYGDLIFVYGSPTPISEPLNPDEFNWKKYYQWKHIGYQINATKKSIERLESGKGNFWNNFTLSLATNADNLLKANLPLKEYALGTALLLGNRVELEFETKQAWSNAGAMHVLAVSGMHVVVLFGLIFKILGEVGKKGRLKWPYGISVLWLVWLYALFTGCSASVIRAAFMFSVIIMAQLLNRKSNTLNTLSFTAFALMLWNPYYLFDVGAQLSFLAVAGIVILVPEMQKWTTDRPKWIQWIWEGTAVALAAQLFTFPLGMYYFHQFPNLFWLANLVIVLLGNAALISGMAFLILAKVPLLGFALAFITEWLLKFSNHFIYFVSTLPYAITNNIWLEFYQCFAIYGLIIFGLLFIFRKNLFWLKLALICSLITALANLNLFVERKEINRLGLFHIRKKTVLVTINQGKASIYSADRKLPYQLKNNAIRLAYSENYKPFNNLLQLDSCMKLAFWHGKSILILEKAPSKKFRPSHPILVDYLLVTNNAIYRPDWLLNKINFTLLLADGSNSFLRAKRLEENCRKLNIPCWNTYSKGAFSIKF